MIYPRSICLVNNKRITFTLTLGIYENILTFLDSNEIGFLSTMTLESNAITRL